MNLEKNYINYLLIDVGNTLIKFGIYFKKKWYIQRIDTSKCKLANACKIIKRFIEKFPITKIYVCSVVKRINLVLTNSFSKLNIDFYFIKQSDFINIISFSSKAINIDEVGNDILVILYYIRHMHNLIVCNFGSALVTIKKSEKVDGVLIYPDLKNALKLFLKNINLKSSIEIYNNFGNTTSQAISGSLFFLIDGYVNNILKYNPNCNNIIYSGGNRQIMQLVNIPKNVQIDEVDEIVLKGMRDFVCNCLSNNK